MLVLLFLKSECSYRNNGHYGYEEYTDFFHIQSFFC
jgi:hypothetical protein